MPVLLDTNVYLDALKSAAAAARFEPQFLPLVVQTSLSSVVIEELYAGALDDLAVRLVERQVGALERVWTVVTPLVDDWKKAGKLVARITRREPGREFKVQEMLNDILLALSARRIGADLYTLDRDDFELIHRYQPFSLKLLDH